MSHHEGLVHSEFGFRAHHNSLIKLEWQWFFQLLGFPFVNKASDVRYQIIWDWLLCEKGFWSWHWCLILNLVGWLPFVDWFFIDCWLSLHFLSCSSLVQWVVLHHQSFSFILDVFIQIQIWLSHQIQSGSRYFHWLAFFYPHLSQLLKLVIEHFLKIVCLNVWKLGFIFIMDACLSISVLIHLNIFFFRHQF